MKELLRAHLSVLIEFDGLGYDEPKENTLECAANTLHEEVIKGCNYRGGLANKFKEALQGLPSYIHMPFENWEIANLMYALGMEFDRDNDDQYNDAVDLYWKLCGEILADAFMNNKEFQL